MTNGIQATKTKVNNPNSIPIPVIADRDATGSVSIFFSPISHWTVICRSKRLATSKAITTTDMIRNKSRRLRHRSTAAVPIVRQTGSRYEDPSFMVS
jgi:hypothetical protein